jgi:hypothetical protein
MIIIGPVHPSHDPSPGLHHWQAHRCGTASECRRRRGAAPGPELRCPGQGCRLSGSVQRSDSESGAAAAPGPAPTHLLHSPGGHVRPAGELIFLGLKLSASELDSVNLMMMIARPARGPARAWGSQSRCCRDRDQPAGRRWARRVGSRADPERRRPGARPLTGPSVTVPADLDGLTFPMP